MDNIREKLTFMQYMKCCRIINKTEQTIGIVRQQWCIGDEIDDVVECETSSNKSNDVLIGNRVGKVLEQ